MLEPFDLLKACGDELVAILRKMDSTSITSLRQTCRFFDAFVVEKKAHIAVPYKHPVDICISSPDGNKDELKKKLDSFSLAFAGLVIENVYCNGTCNNHGKSCCMYKDYLEVLKGLKFKCKRLTVAQVQEEIVEIIRPEILVIEDYSRGDLLSSNVHSLELTFFTGPLPDLVENNFIRELTIKPDTSRDLIETIQLSLTALIDNKLGSVERLEISRSHMKTSVNCRGYLQESLETLSDELGPGEIFVNEPSCRANETIYSKAVTIERRRWNVSLYNEMDQSACTIYIRIELA